MREFRLEKKSEADFRTCLIRQVRNQTRIFWTGGGDGMRCHAMDHAKMKEFRLEKRSEVGRLTACDVMSCHACHVHVMSCPCHVMSMSCHVMACHVHVMSCYGMRCHVMSCMSCHARHVMSCHVMSMPISCHVHVMSMSMTIEF